MLHCIKCTIILDKIAEIYLTQIDKIHFMHLLAKFNKLV